MLIFLALAAAWTLFLFLLRPAPIALREAMPSRSESFKRIQASYWLGMVLIAVFAAGAEATFPNTNIEWIAALAMNNFEPISLRTLGTAFSHSFVHVDFVHLAANLSVLGLLTFYERRAGARRVLSLFMLGGSVSFLSVFFLPDPTFSAGASAGLFALAAAFVLDHPKLQKKEILGGCFVLGAIFSILSFSQILVLTGSEYQFTDHWAHLLGLVTGSIYTIRSGLAG